MLRETTSRGLCGLVCVCVYYCRIECVFLLQQDLVQSCLRVFLLEIVRGFHLDSLRHTANRSGGIGLGSEAAPWRAVPVPKMLPMCR